MESYTRLFLNYLMQDDLQATQYVKLVNEELKYLLEQPTLSTNEEELLNEILRITETVMKRQTKSACTRAKAVSQKLTPRLTSLIQNVQQEITQAQNHPTYPEGHNRAMVENVNKQADLEYRSKMAGQAMRYNNPDIADLSDINRPTKVAERFSELYDNEWTEAFEALHKPKIIKNDEDVIRLLLDIVERAYTFCAEEAERQIVDMRLSVLSVMNGGVLKQRQGQKTAGDGLLVQYRKSIASLAVDRLVQTFREKEVPQIFATRRMDPPKEGKPVDLYTKKAVELTWWMCVQDPTIHMCLSSDKLDPSECPVLYRAYTRSGKNPDFFVWPALKLHKNGGVLMKGVMQFK